MNGGGPGHPTWLVLDPRLGAGERWSPPQRRPAQTGLRDHAAPRGAADHPGVDAGVTNSHVAVSRSGSRQPPSGGR